MKKKLTAMLLIMSMVCTFLPVSAMAAETAPEAAIGDVQYATLEEALEKAADGATITLLSDANISDSKYDANNSYNVAVIAKNLTIDGGQEKHTITCSNRGFFVQGPSDNQANLKTVTFQNLTIENATGEGRCIDTRGGYVALVLDGVTLDTSKGSSNTQLLTIGGDHSGLGDGYLMPVTIKNSTLTANDAGYGVITFNPVDMTIENSDITGYAALYMKNGNGSKGSAGSKVDVINGSVLTGNNPHPAGSSSSFATIAVDDPRIIINVDNSKVVSNATGGEEQYAFSFWTPAVEGSRVTITGNSSVALKGELAIFKDVIADTTITGGTFTKDGAPLDVSEYLDANLTQNSDGTIVPMDVADAIAKVGNDYYKSLIAAVKAANNGETVTLLKDATENVIIPKGKNLTLDLNGKTLTSAVNNNHTVIVDGGTLNVTDSTVGQPVVGDYHENVIYEGSGIIQTFETTVEMGNRIYPRAIIAKNGGILNLQGGTVYSNDSDAIYIEGGAVMNMTGGYINSKEYGIGVKENGTTLNFSGGVVRARNNAAIAGNGADNDGTIITINGGTLIGEMSNEAVEKGYIACGIYHPQEGTLTVNGGNIYVHGGAGIVARAGAATINNVNIVTTGNTTGKVGDSRVVVPCSAVVVDEAANYPGGNLDTDIKGGRLCFSRWRF